MIILMLHFSPQIEVCDSYNPLLVQSNLYKCLIAQSIKSNSVSKSVKRRFQAPQVGRIQLSTHSTWANWDDNSCRYNTKIFYHNSWVCFGKFQKSQASKQEGRSNQSVANQQSKRTTSRAQMQQVVFTAPNETVSTTSHNEFRSAAAVFSSSKRFRSNSAANLYNSNPPTFPDDL